MFDGSNAWDVQLEADFRAELAQIQAESIGWMPLEEGVYLHGVVGGVMLPQDYSSLADAGLFFVGIESQAVEPLDKMAQSESSR